MEKFLHYNANICNFSDKSSNLQCGAWEHETAAPVRLWQLCLITPDRRQYYRVCRGQHGVTLRGVKWTELFSFISTNRLKCANFFSIEIILHNIVVKILLNSLQIADYWSMVEKKNIKKWKMSNWYYTIHWIKIKIIPYYWNLVIFVLNIFISGNKEKILFVSAAWWVVWRSNQVPSQDYVNPPRGSRQETLACCSDIYFIF